MNFDRLRKSFVNDFMKNKNLKIPDIRSTIFFDGTLLAVGMHHHHLEEKYILLNVIGGSHRDLIVRGYYNVEDNILSFPKEYFNGNEPDIIMCNDKTCPSTIVRTTSSGNECGVVLELINKSKYATGKSIVYTYKCNHCEYGTFRYRWLENPMTGDVYNILIKEYFINKITDATGEILR